MNNDNCTQAPGDADSNNRTRAPDDVEEVVLDPVKSTAATYEVKRAGDLHWGLYLGDQICARALDRDEARLRAVALKLNDYDRMQDDYTNKRRTLDAKIAVQENSARELAAMRQALEDKVAEYGETTDATRLDEVARHLKEEDGRRGIHARDGGFVVITVRCTYRGATLREALDRSIAGPVNGGGSSAGSGPKYA